MDLKFLQLPLFIETFPQQQLSMPMYTFIDTSEGHLVGKSWRLLFCLHSLEQLQVQYDIKYKHILIYWFSNYADSKVLSRGTVHPQMAITTDYLEHT